MRGEPSTGELQALAGRQHQQLENQARLIAAREHRLRQVRCRSLRPLRRRRRRRRRCRRRVWLAAPWPARTYRWNHALLDYLELPSFT